MGWFRNQLRLVGWLDSGVVLCESSLVLREHMGWYHTMSYVLEVGFICLAWRTVARRCWLSVLCPSPLPDLLRMCMYLYHSSVAADLL